MAAGYVSVSQLAAHGAYHDVVEEITQKLAVTPEDADRTVEEFLGDFVPEVVMTEQIAKWYGE
jgi:hypothetical protein